MFCHGGSCTGNSTFRTRRGLRFYVAVVSPPPSLSVFRGVDSGIWGDTGALRIGEVKVSGGTLNLPLCDAVWTLREQFVVDFKRRLK